MLRFAMLVSIAAVIASAVTLYVVNYSTRALSFEVDARERHIDELTRDIAVQKAERAYLLRPERLEPAARALGMTPLDGRQIGVWVAPRVDDIGSASPHGRAP